MQKKLTQNGFTDFNVRYKATKLGEESTEENLERSRKEKYM